MLCKDEKIVSFTSKHSKLLRAWKLSVSPPVCTGSAARLTGGVQLLLWDSDLSGAAFCHVCRYVFGCVKDDTSLLQNYP